MNQSPNGCFDPSAQFGQIWDLTIKIPYENAHGGKSTGSQLTESMKDPFNEVQLGGVLAVASPIYGEVEGAPPIGIFGAHFSQSIFEKLIIPLLATERNTISIEFWVYAGRGGVNRPFVYNTSLYQSNNGVFTMTEEAFSLITQDMFVEDSNVAKEYQTGDGTVFEGIIQYFPPEAKNYDETAFSIIFIIKDPLSSDFILNEL